MLPHEKQQKYIGNVSSLGCMGYGQFIVCELLGKWEVSEMAEVANSRLNSSLLGKLKVPLILEHFEGSGWRTTCSPRGFLKGSRKLKSIHFTLRP
jgi:hypothetical protein